MNEVTARVEFEQESASDGQIALTLSENQLALIAGGQCTTNSI